MMTRLTNDPAFWAWLWTFVGLLFTAAGALLGLVIAWAKAKTAQLEAKSAQAEASAAKDSATAVAVGQGYQQQTLVQHTAAIAALQATSQGAAGSPPQRGGGQGAALPPAPVAPVVPPLAPQAGTSSAWPPSGEQDSPATGG